MLEAIATRVEAIASKAQDFTVGLCHFPFCHRALYVTDFTTVNLSRLCAPHAALIQLCAIQTPPMRTKHCPCTSVGTAKFAPLYTFDLSPKARLQRTLKRQISTQAAQNTYRAKSVRRMKHIYSTHHQKSRVHRRPCQCRMGNTTRTRKNCFATNMLLANTTQPPSHRE